MRVPFRLAIIAIVCVLFNRPSFGQEAPVPLIPAPQKVQWADRWQSFDTFKVESDDAFSDKVEMLTDLLEEYGARRVQKSAEAEVLISLRRGEVENPHGYSGAYELKIDENIRIVSPQPSGVFYAIQTIKQLIRKESRSIRIPYCTIYDWPAFKVRGFMHDVGRNYQSMELLKEQLDVMAAYKFNVFHMHITDNPGWRLESNIYPELQSEEATSRKPGKYYTQKEFVELVEYAANRHITLIPELDIPGHTGAFRKALDITSMNTDKVQNIILDLIDELAGLVPQEKMPYIHLGTDEARHESEKVDDDFLGPIFERVRQHGRQVISWRPGIEVPGDSTTIYQLWTGQSMPKPGHSFIDSRANYINHLDPLAGMYRLFFQQPCRAPHGDQQRLGGILCAWHDNRIEDERNILRQNPIYPSMVTYSEAVWTGKQKSYGRTYWSRLPSDSSDAYQEYLQFEERLTTHRDLFFKGKPFPYVKNGHIPWKIIGSFNHEGNLDASFPVEEHIRDAYTVDDKKYQWWDENVFGGTIHLRHFFGFPSYLDEDSGTVYALTYLHSPKDQEVDFWIGFHNWSRAGGRRGGPAPSRGEWHNTNPKVWVNNEAIAPPRWQQPDLPVNSDEVPFIDEDYFYRPSTEISLRKGWNKVLLKVPHGGTSWKWMFTFVPVKWDGTNVREVTDIKFSTEPSGLNSKAAGINEFLIRRLALCHRVMLGAMIPVF